LRYEPAVESIDLARRGNAAALRELLAPAPDVLASTPHAAKLLRLSVLAGRMPVVELLLNKGVDMNKPSPLALVPSRDFETLIFVTLLCAARLKRRKDIEVVLLRHGAKEDIFTHSFLGDLGPMEKDLADEPSSAQASDPAVDAFEITPIHRVEALRALLARALDAKEPLRGCNRALRMAVAHENVAIVMMLIEHGADATTIGAGRWVMHPELAAIISRPGARVDRSGNWIQLSCTGNQGRKDDPEYVAALLRHGARIDDRRETVQNDRRRTGDRAALCRQSRLYQDHRGSARSRCRSGLGLTLLDWLARASKSVDRDAIRRLLRRQRARRPASENLHRCRLMQRSKKKRHSFTCVCTREQAA
jgi:hypothetical protein